MKLLEELARRQLFGMRPGLDRIAAACAALDHPERHLGRVIHVAGTNGKGETCALLDTAFRHLGYKVARYTSPHLVRLNERFFFNGEPVSDDLLEQVAEGCGGLPRPLYDTLSYFEYLTLIAYKLFADLHPDFTILETGLGGRLDATNVCMSEIAVITRIGLDHCAWLGDTVEQIAAEKAGIIKPGSTVILGENEPSVQAVIKSRADARGAHYLYAPCKNSFKEQNRAVALAVLSEILAERKPEHLFSGTIWPGRYQRVGDYLIDGAHNPPAAEALVAALQHDYPHTRFTLIAGFCGDKDVDAVLRILAPVVSTAIPVKTNNPRSLSPEALAAKMHAAGIAVEPKSERGDTAYSPWVPRGGASGHPRCLVCGSLFLAGEMLVKLGAYPWGSATFDLEEKLK